MGVRLLVKAGGVFEEWPWLLWLKPGLHVVESGDKLG